LGARRARSHLAPDQKARSTTLHQLLDELTAAGHFPEEQDEQLAEFMSGFMILNAKLAGALSGLAHGNDSPEGGLVIAWLKRVLEILNKTLAAAGAVGVKPFLAAERFAYYRGELFAIREEILELITRLRSQ
jgi:hypothetical protein